MRAVASKKGHIHWHDSELTKLQRDDFGALCKFVLLVSGLASQVAEPACC